MSHLDDDDDDIYESQQQQFSKQQSINQSQNNYNQNQNQLSYKKQHRQTPAVNLKIAGDEINNQNDIEQKYKRQLKNYGNFRENEFENNLSIVKNNQNNKQAIQDRIITQPAEIEDDVCYSKEIYDNYQDQIKQIENQNVKDNEQFANEDEEDDDEIIDFDNVTSKKQSQISNKLSHKISEKQLSKTNSIKKNSSQHYNTNGTSKINRNSNFSQNMSKFDKNDDDNLENQRLNEISQLNDQNIMEQTKSKFLNQQQTETNGENEDEYGQFNSDIQMKDMDPDQKFNQNFFSQQSRSGFQTLTYIRRSLPNKTLQILGDQEKQEQNNNNISLTQNNPNNQIQGQQEQRMNQKFIEALQNIENQKNYRKYIEQFLIEFNQKPQKGIDYAISVGLCKSSPKEIAKFLILSSHEGINKTQLGQYFGSNKQLNQKVLKNYIYLLDFSDLKFDVAIRQLLARFKLPGEADQIDRIVQIFGEAYMTQNPGFFKHADVPYILTYSCIMLNVDAHNEKIEPKRKMKKEQFVKQNILCLKDPKYQFKDEEFLEYLYDNITKQKFETKVDDIEKGLDKIMAIYGQQGADEHLSQQDLQKIEHDLKNQKYNYLKYGRKGKPHSRVVFLSQNGDQVCWHDSGKNDPPRSIKINDIIDLAMGSQTTEVFRKNQVPPEFDELCFSIITKFRTLDLQTGDKQIKYKWIQLMYYKLKQKRKEITKKITLKRRKQINREQISEIWKADIFPHWEKHWDYKLDKPKHFQKRNNSFFSQFCKCFVKWKQNQEMKNDSKALQSRSKANNYKTDNLLDCQISDNQRSADGQGDLLDFQNKSGNKKSFLLISLWKLGIPAWARSTIWPLAIGNRLELTKQLYYKLLNQAQACETIVANKVRKLNTEENDKDTFQYIQEINDEVANLQPFKTNNNEQFGHLIPQDFESQKKSIKNILSAFVFYRPDVGFFKNHMTKIAQIFITYLDEETAFQCFTNLLHNFHFLSFFRGEMREIEWRVRFFEKALERNLGLVFHHFKAIDMSTELFILQWFLSLFANSLDNIEFLSRIWDCFFLEGEVFAIKVAMGILQFFQLELKMSTFQRAQNILQNIPDILTEEHLFDIIQNIDISWQEYQQVLQNQKIASINPLIHQGLLNI
ncbi:Sec7 domain [Pseudocohnilembus persalinus]|uniref:Sec7 domain n=1 Tax=Pseudocohnilembus persalinus TaxID=266149 RepID=A0A0V0R697_PSEPJ|nr:Sec7 domain [Pseudocohnilembus persalinus]|eukprot:KRX09995.1 Sec7 domain [Pseudocohnilembus persalinus]